MSPGDLLATLLAGAEESGIHLKSYKRRHTGAETEIEAIQRELQEETGSQLYRIIKRYDEKICFVFGEEVSSLTRYDKQETTMFLIEYRGDRIDLHPQEEELDQIRFFSSEEVLQWLSHDESKRFYEQVVLA